MPGRRLKILRASGLRRLGCFLLLATEIVEIGVAVAAADGLEMKVDVLGVTTVEGAKQVAAKLLASGAREPLPPPNLAHAVHAGVAAGVNRRKLFEEFGLLAQLRLDRRHFRRRQCLVEVGLEVGLGDTGHQGSAYSSGNTSCDKSCRLISVLNRAMKSNL